MIPFGELPTQTTNLMRQGFGWIRAGLGLTDAPVPTELYTGAVVPNLDMLQNGWGFSTPWRFFNIVHPAASAAVDYSPVGTLSTDLTRMVIEASIQRGGGAGNTNVRFNLKNQVAATFNELVVVNNLMPIGPSFASSRGGDLSSTAVPNPSLGITGWRPIIVPPGFELVWKAPATAAGETMILSGIFLEVPAGLKVW